MKHAIVRAPGASFAAALSSEGATIDVTLAQAQHREYCAALVAAGLTVERLPPDEAHPDSCFVQDPAVVIGERAVICRLVAPSRRGEEAALAAALSERFPQTRIVAPGLLEGGDVMLTPDRILIGLSGRTNRAGIAQLTVALADLGLPVYDIPVSGYLHLLTAATYVGHNILLVVEDYADHPAFADFDVIAVPPGEAYAANALGVGDRVVLPAGSPHTAGALRDRGFEPLPVPMSEFARADGGVTCLALVW